MGNIETGNRQPGGDGHVVRVIASPAQEPPGAAEIDEVSQPSVRPGKGPTRRRFFQWATAATVGASAVLGRLVAFVPTAAAQPLTVGTTTLGRR